MRLTGNCKNCGSTEFDGAHSYNSVMYLCWRCRAKNPELIEELSPIKDKIIKDREEYERKALDREAKMLLVKELSVISSEMQKIRVLLQQIMEDK